MVMDTGISRESGGNGSNYHGNGKKLAKKRGIPTIISTFAGNTAEMGTLTLVILQTDRFVNIRLLTIWPNLEAKTL